MCVHVVGAVGEVLMGMVGVVLVVLVGPTHHSYMRKNPQKM